MLIALAIMSMLLLRATAAKCYPVAAKGSITRLAFQARVGGARRYLSASPTRARPLPTLACSSSSPGEVLEPVVVGQYDEGEEEEEEEAEALGMIPPEQPSRVHFVIEGDPVPLRRHRVANNRMYNPSYAAQRRFLEMAKPSLPSTPLVGPLEATLVFKLKRPRSHYRTGRYSHLLRDNAPQFHTSRTDLDNLVKMVLDSINEHAYLDDRQVVSVRAIKTYCERDVGSTEVTLAVLGEGLQPSWLDVEAAGVVREEMGGTEAAGP